MLCYAVAGHGDTADDDAEDSEADDDAGDDTVMMHLLFCYIITKNQKFPIDPQSKSSAAIVFVLVVVARDDLLPAAILRWFDKESESMNRCTYCEVRQKKLPRST